MEYLAPPLNAVLHIQAKIKSGFSVRTALHLYIQDFPECPFARQMGRWVFCLETGKVFRDPTLSSKSYRRALLHILGRGLKGEPILDFLKASEEELSEVGHQELKSYVKKQAFLTLIPLFLLQVPAFLLLLLGPLILELKESLVSF